MEVESIPQLSLNRHPALARSGLGAAAGLRRVGRANCDSMIVLDTNVEWAITLRICSGGVWRGGCVRGLGVVAGSDTTACDAVGRDWGGATDGLRLAGLLS